MGGTDWFLDDRSFASKHVFKSEIDINTIISVLMLS